MIKDSQPITPLHFRIVIEGTGATLRCTEARLFEELRTLDGEKKKWVVVKG